MRNSNASWCEKLLDLTCDIITTNHSFSDPGISLSPFYQMIQMIHMIPASLVMPWSRLEQVSTLWGRISISLLNQSLCLLLQFCALLCSTLSSTLSSNLSSLYFFTALLSKGWRTTSTTGACPTWKISRGINGSLSRSFENASLTADHQANETSIPIAQWGLPMVHCQHRERRPPQSIPLQAS